MRLTEPISIACRRWLHGSCTSSALLAGILGSWLYIGPQLHALADDLLLASQHASTQRLASSATGQSAPVPAAPAASTPEPTPVVQTAHTRAAAQVPPQLTAAAARSTPPRRARTALKRQHAATPTTDVVYRPSPSVVNANTRADMDLMNIPSSPLEAQALAEARARFSASLDRLQLMPDPECPKAMAERGSGR